eukprot:CAMPEP_0118708000 /NCGR_PEP_ID=MMETSP0800-20121206/21588_1 /TAXON_ID=210618 ORGANISM="Striatella unipunctata, Strain CCMP2910" /NCGR_SAMPLE_ID=MMETSP0800 /ASSEMBLY_ACC=CAM_ASM_000638 /LENGTH=57 /DNA_ID=CAMNT_0006611033 /DNA_START=115 /DNA_END=285 /DNA_ORIENTATION=+
MAKSLLKKLSQKIQNESTQESISQYLRSTTSGQILSLATMAGIPIDKSQSERLARYA